MKRCPRCTETLPLTKFYRSAGYCKPCHVDYAAQRRARGLTTLRPFESFWRRLNNKALTQRQHVARASQNKSARV